jgi:hypothetical protein
MKEKISFTIFRDDEQKLRKFSILYHDLKDAGTLPKDIRERIVISYNISEATYYRCLRLARENGFISDSFNETRAAYKDRIRSTRIKEQESGDIVRYQGVDIPDVLEDSNESHQEVINNTEDEIVKPEKKKNWFSRIWRK